jgi:hypothetical protein
MNILLAILLAIFANIQIANHNPIHKCPPAKPVLRIIPEGVPHLSPVPAK